MRILPLPPAFRTADSSFRSRWRTIDLRRAALCLFAIFLAVWALDCPAEEIGPRQGMVRILSENPSGAKRVGSGFVVGFEHGLTYILTAAHVVEGDPQPHVIFAAVPDQRYAARVAQLSTQLDVAVLKIQGWVPRVVRLPLDERPVEPPEEVQALGFAHGARLPRWSSASAAASEGSRVILDKSLASGHSGGPLLRNGWVIGLIQKTEGSYAYAISADLLRKTLEGWKVPVDSSARREARDPVETTDASDPESERWDPPASSSGVPKSRPTGCYISVASETGASRPVRALASPSAPAHFSLPAGTVVTIQKTQAGSGHTWHHIHANSHRGPQSGWIRSDHVQHSPGCSR